MMIDGKGCLLVLALIALAGFILGAIASIWFGPIAMLVGAVGLPLACIILLAIGLLIGALT